MGHCESNLAPRPNLRNRYSCTRHKPCLSWGRWRAQITSTARLAPISRSIHPTDQSEAPESPGVFHAGTQVSAVHLRPALLRPGYRPADGRDRGEVTRHRAVDWLLHGDGPRAP